MSQSLAVDFSKIPSVRTAELPSVYVAAQQALAACKEIDECREWKNRAAALASYARQAEDDTLYNMAVSIRSRAIQRCGQLLAEVEKAAGGNHKSKNGSGPVFGRIAAAEDAGLSEYERLTALRVAAIPEERFKELVERDRPVSLAALVREGTKKRPPATTFDLQGLDPEDFSVATQICGAIRTFAERTASADIDTVVRGTFRNERPRLRQHIGTSLAWLKALLSAIDKEEKR